MAGSVGSSFARLARGFGSLLDDFSGLAEPARSSLARGVEIAFAHSKLGSGFSRGRPPEYAVNDALGREVVFQLFARKRHRFIRFLQALQREHAGFDRRFGLAVSPLRVNFEIVRHLDHQFLFSLLPLHLDNGAHGEAKKQAEWRAQWPFARAGENAKHCFLN
ncbi:hypothetical protein C6P72_09850 [Burkholderia gladioli]|nr:hypothetical protein C6P72_09850 [Burkholderia gladioli]